MKYRKATVEDNIAAEQIKATSYENLIAWLKLYNRVWKTEKILSD